MNNNNNKAIINELYNYYCCNDAESIKNLISRLESNNSNILANNPPPEIEQKFLYAITFAMCNFANIKQFKQYTKGYFKYFPTDPTNILKICCEINKPNFIEFLLNDYSNKFLELQNNRYLSITILHLKTEATLKLLSKGYELDYVCLQKLAYDNGRKLKIMLEEINHGETKFNNYTNKDKTTKNYQSNYNLIENSINKAIKLLKNNTKESKIIINSLQETLTQYKNYNPTHSQKIERSKTSSFSSKPLFGKLNILTKSSIFNTLTTKVNQVKISSNKGNNLAI
jgi:hypothetical protein